MARVVIDTNVFISGLLGSRTSRQFIQLVREKKIGIVISPELLNELIQVASQPKFKEVISPPAVKTLSELIKSRALFVSPTRRIKICRHPADNRILECAVSGNVEFIITNDKDLLSLNPYKDITIITPWEYLNSLKTFPNIPIIPPQEFLKKRKRKI